MLVEIRRSGNLIDITPPCEDILSPVLSYQHRSMSYGKGGRIEITERKLYKVDAHGRLTTFLGLRERAQQALTKAGHTFQYTDLSPSKLPPPDWVNLFKTIPGLKFREGQQKILASLSLNDRGTFVAPTGYGKSFMMTMICLIYPSARIIIVEPNISIMHSLYQALSKYIPDVGRIGGGFNKADRVTVCVANSLLRAPIQTCDLLLMDEMHCASARVISTNLAKVRNAKMFGFTATPTGRSDGAEIVGESLFGPIRCTIDYAAAQAGGVVSPIKVAVVEVDTRITCVSSAGKTLQAVKKRWCYWRNEARNQAIAWAVDILPARYGFSDPQTLILVETLEHAFRIAKHLPEYEVVYATVNPLKFQNWKSKNLVPSETEILTSDKRMAMLKDFMSGKLRKVIATSTWGTGVDFVNLDVLVYASGAPGEIRSTQWPGRNSRTRQGKSFGLMIDFSDSWDPWTRRRAQLRLKTYKKHGWSIANAGSPQLNYKAQEGTGNSTMAADPFCSQSVADQASSGTSGSLSQDEDDQVSDVPTGVQCNE